MLVDLDVEEIRWLVGIRVEARLGLPVAPTDVVQARGHEQALASSDLAGPRLGELARNDCVVDLQHDLGSAAGRATDH